MKAGAQPMSWTTLMETVPAVSHGRPIHSDSDMTVRIRCSAGPAEKHREVPVVAVEDRRDVVVNL